jgi:hypothetical protein
MAFMRKEFAFLHIYEYHIQMEGILICQ